MLHATTPYVGQILAKRGNGFRGTGGFEMAGECEITRNDLEIVQVFSLSSKYRMSTSLMTRPHSCI
jgi:hypothetical protein